MSGFDGMRWMEEILKSISEGEDLVHEKAAAAGETAGRGGLQAGVNHCEVNVPGPGPESNAVIVGHDDRVDFPLSFFSRAKSKSSEASMSLTELIANVHGIKWKAQVEELRTHLAQGDQAGYDSLKKQLPAVTASGRITGQRKEAPEEGRFEHSGLLQCDFDGKEHPGMATPEIMGVVRRDPHVIAAFFSPSGKGVKAFILIPKDLASHGRAFRAAEVHFRALGLTLDTSTKDPGRLCFVSYDPSAWIREGEVPELEIGPNDPEPTSGSSKMDAALIGGLLAHIPSRPPYMRWVKILSAVFNEVGLIEGISLLEKWSPEETKGEYAEKFTARFEKPTVRYLMKLAREHGYSAELAALDIPPGIFPLPGGEVGYELSAEIIFKAMALTKRVFYRDRLVVEITQDVPGAEKVAPISPESLSTLVETFGARVARRQITKSGEEKGGKKQRICWRTDVMKPYLAKVLLKSTAAQTHLPPLRKVTGCSVIVEPRPGMCELLGPGYHPQLGGIYVTGNQTPVEDFPLRAAVSCLKKLLDDFDFPTPGDYSRAMAMLISPALKMGELLEADFPIDISEADQSQAGKSYRLRLVAALYNEMASVVTDSNGGVGSLDESISGALINGGTFINIDNFRGKMGSAVLESALRGQGSIQCRAFRVSATVDTTSFLFQLSTNGAELTRDLANRSVVTRLRKRQGGTYTKWHEGDLIKHVKANHRLYFGCIYTIVREWVNRGKPRTEETRHDFKEWCQSLDWIVQHLCGLTPLLDGHRELQDRTSNPGLMWLRELCHAASKAGKLDVPLTTKAIFELSDESGLDLPGRPDSNEPAHIRVGKFLARCFGANRDEISVDGFVVSKSVDAQYQQKTRKTDQVKTYRISKPSIP